MKYPSGPRWSPLLVLLVLVSGGVASAAQPRINLGGMQDPASPDIRWGYVNVEISTFGPYGSTTRWWGILPPAVHNRLILDTGANSALFVAEAAAELVSRGMEALPGTYTEIGVSGTETYYVSKPYSYQFWGTGNPTRYTVSPEGQTQVMFHPEATIGGSNLEDSIYPIPGLLGMPAMTGRVTTFDMHPWTVLSEDITFLDTSFSDVRPTSAPHRYSVELRAEPEFGPAPTPPDGPVPVWANVPFATVRAENGNISATGNFLIDTGANSSLLSTAFAFALGLDSDGDGVLTDLDENFVAWAEVTGVGGTIRIPVFGVERLLLPTREGIELAWGDDVSPPMVGILDIVNAHEKVTH